jgi:hypothetical protein
MRPLKGIRKIARQHPAKDNIPMYSQSGYVTFSNKGSKKGNDKRIPEINEIEAARFSLSIIEVIPADRKNINRAPPNPITTSSIEGS